MGLDFERESRELLGESALVPYTVCVALALASPWEEAGVVCSSFFPCVSGPESLFVVY